MSSLPETVVDDAELGALDNPPLLARPIYALPLLRIVGIADPLRSIPDVTVDVELVVEHASRAIDAADSSRNRSSQQGVEETSA